MIPDGAMRCQVLAPDQSYTWPMPTLLIACIMIGGPGHARSVALLGEWCAWRITSGSTLVDPPKLLKGELILKANGTYTSHVEELGFGERSKGTYRVLGKRIIFKGAHWSDIKGEKGVHYSELFPLFHRDGQLWADGYLHGEGSYVYIRPGKRFAIPHDYKDWPSLTDFGPPTAKPFPKTPHSKLRTRQTPN
jgi:hypothetical protein